MRNGATKPSFIREGTNQLSTNSRYPIALHNILERRMKKTLNQKEMHAEYFSEGIRLCFLLQKFYEFELNFAKWKKSSLCPSCLEYFCLNDICISQCSRSIHIPCFEKWKEVNKLCQICNKKRKLETVYKDLLVILDEKNFPFYQNDSNEQLEDESDKLKQQNAILHLRMAEAALMLEKAMKLKDDQQIRRMSQ
nr:Bm295 [Brugia malayi]